MKLTLQAPREKGDWLQKPLILPLEKGKVTGVVGVPKREQGAKVIRGKPLHSLPISGGLLFSSILV